MMAWLAAHVARRCPPFVSADADRQWRRMLPHDFARHLPALGPVLVVAHAAHGSDTTRRGLPGGPCELAALPAMRWLIAASSVDSDGPHEWIECRDARGRLCLQLHLLPDTDYLGWETLTSLAGSGPAPGDRPAPVHGEPEALRVCDFRCDGCAGLPRLHAVDRFTLSWPGMDAVRTMARITRLPFAGLASIAPAAR